MFELKNLTAGLDIPNVREFVAPRRISQQLAVRTDSDVDDPLLRCECFRRSGVCGLQQLLAGTYIPGKGKIAAGSGHALSVTAECQVERGFTTGQGTQKFLTLGIKK